ncbi:hypothetical protein DPSP01_007203 [Paraphaeosphaeria sporulosa]|uniref:DUF605-domain-containing protein n=1 Tax=Paraphaeosphaeria sporulosa TaxID=1460663 RepID=A0A177CPY9_9PLEO|nr:DUF605-domain-containing protein [Paraphaeosphaeria sporulosa]OAG08839.1 DUF605-domain-containing protein [Paraphaeosphaeria sporulosa]
MAESIPAKLKAAQITPFVQRAAQLERFKPFITYWLRYYIIQKIIAAGLHTADAECTTYTANLMDQLEQTKAANPDEDALHDETAAQAYCEQFAFTTFAKGEKDMTANAVTKNTADTLLAAATFFEMLTIWKKDPESEIKSKQKFAKYHAARILKALRNGEDPNVTNPAHETPAIGSPSALDPNDPEVQNLAPDTASPSTRNPYQPYVESAPDTTAQPSPTISAPKVSPPPMLPSAPTDYSAHRDVSPISQPGNNSRQGSVVSEGGGYFPRVNVPTFTADTAAPNLPTAPSVEDEPMGGNPFDPSSLASSLPTGPQIPQSPQAPSPQDYYHKATSPAPLGQNPHQAPSPQVSYQPSPNPYATPPPQPQQPAFQRPHQPHFNNSFAPHQPQHAPPPHQYTQAPQAAMHQGPFRTDEEAQMAAAKHAKWAISALNFEDVNTAVKELRLALQSLGAN